uniref:Transmembrane protein 182 n=1 Tax=Dromaius novaehollandiae TaxID=8790 RepID=A0A8C4JFE4_DRONO
MKLSVGIFFGGFFAALGVLLFLVAFGTDYWLLATEIGRCSKGPEDAGVSMGILIHNKNYMCRFLGCIYFGSKNRTSKKYRILFFSFPSSFSPVYRGFWTVLMLLGVVTIVTASFFIICAAPFASHVLYKAGGGLFIIAGILFSLVVVMYVIWVQVMADLENYTNMKKMECPDFAVYVCYGWSFMLAPIGVFFALLAGMLFLLIGRTIYLHSD